VNLRSLFILRVKIRVDKKSPVTLQLNNAWNFPQFNRYIGKSSYSLNDHEEEKHFYRVYMEINETIKIIGESETKPQLIRYVSEVF
jgi:hypothetical protein